MKLLFTRNPDKTIETKIDNNGELTPFSYEAFINALYLSVIFDTPVFPEDIMPVEKEKILEMVSRIQQIVAEEHASRAETILQPEQLDTNNHEPVVLL